jgi:ATP-dependent helicase Lhr and Lhr-like helicase
VDPLAAFSPATRAWFARAFEAPSPPQALGWPAIARGEHTLILAPTGTGKTLAAFLYCLDRIAAELAEGRTLDGVQALYVSPLKALSNDVSRNLEAPLAGIQSAARELGLLPPAVTVGLRTGDTPPSERARLGRTPPHVLVTTPESLYLLLTSKARQTLRSVRWVIVDEIHAVAPNKRGVHLALSLERLEALVAQSGGAPPVRIGLSATQRPMEEIGRFLAGNRPVTLLDTGARKTLELSVASPVEDLAKPPDGIWPAYPPYLAQLIEQNRTTLIFVNNRRSAERLSSSINEVVGRPVARVHHGAMSRKAREEVEGELKAGRIPALVCTSSLELGIDMGSIDLVVQIESPGAVARGLQRVGRAGHLVGAPSRGVILPKWRGDLVECAAVVRAMLDGEVEPTRVPERCLDVLAQQIVAMAAAEEWPVERLYQTVRQAHPYRQLTRAELDAVLEMLGGRYPAEEFAELRPRIVWDRIGGVVRGRPGALRLAVTSGGTIPDKGMYPVELGEGGPKLGELDEEFIHESRVGDVFQLGTGTWRIENIGPNRVTVSPAPGEPPRLPFWKGEGPGRSPELGEAVGALQRRFEEEPEAERWLIAEHHLDANAARSLTAYLAEQRAATGLLPTDRRVVIEHFTDETGDARVVIHAPLGPAVLTPLALLLTRRLAEVTGTEPTFVSSGDGILLRLAATESGPPENPLALLRAAEAEPLLVDLLGDTALFGARFRENAARALLMPRRQPGKRTPLYLQRLRARDLLEVARKHPEFPVLVETYRECLRDAWDLPRLGRLLDDVESGRVEVVTRTLPAPSPFARALLFGFVVSFLYNDDLPKAERRAQLLPVGRGLLSAVLGQSELRQLIDGSVLADEEARARRTAPLLRARSADELHDGLMSLGPLTTDQLGERLVEPERASAFLTELSAAGRILPDEDRWLAAEDLLRYQSARQGDPAALEQLTRRALRAGGPEAAEAIARRAALPVDAVGAALERLAARGEAARGHFRPDDQTSDAEWIDPSLLDRLQRRSLAAARKSIKPVDAETYRRFLLAWQHLSPESRLEGMGGLDRVLGSLAGLSLPTDLLERELLARRVRGYQPSWLDRRISDGDWAYSGAGGSSRMRVALWPRADLGPPTPPPPEEDTPTARVVHHLATRGASFFTDLWHATELDASTLADVLWELLGAGVVTNDRYDPVRRGRAAIGPDRTATRTRPAQLRAQGAGGRWSLCGTPLADPSWWAERLLDRYGIVAREHLEAEEPPVAWRELLDLYKAMELRGQVRRGYFVEGLSGAQFAWPAAVEALRADQPRSAVLVSACDPACAWLPLEVSRVASNFVVLDGGRPALVLETAARRLRSLSADAPPLETLLSLAGTLELDTINDAPARESPLAPRLIELGFERDADRLRRSPLQVKPL